MRSIFRVQISSESGAELGAGLLPLVGRWPARVARPDRSIGLGMSGGGHQRQASGELDQRASQHGELRRWTLPVLAVEKLNLRANVTTGAVRGTTGASPGMTGLNSSSAPCLRSGGS